MLTTRWDVPVLSGSLWGKNGLQIVGVPPFWSSHIYDHEAGLTTHGWEGTWSGIAVEPS